MHVRPSLITCLLCWIQSILRPSEKCPPTQSLRSPGFLITVSFKQTPNTKWNEEEWKLACHCDILNVREDLHARSACSSEQAVRKSQLHFQPSKRQASWCVTLVTACDSHSESVKASQATTIFFSVARIDSFCAAQKRSLRRSFGIAWG